ncbi:hypothetical protein D7D52_22105 [Nocardia yunnanensis]|uniref:Uncharacterized protein n=1 Tax=Nocardia yunnanensis TaxID=2382165 RepID=A0A386ZHM8_9NOCA|nr:hypothetical protein D7D52_22105 [Nocardia yunnanensis]
MLGIGMSTAHERQNDAQDHCQYQHVQSSVSQPRADTTDTLGRKSFGGIRFGRFYPLVRLRRDHHSGLSSSLGLATRSRSIAPAGNFGVDLPRGGDRKWSTALKLNVAKQFLSRAKIGRT